MEPKELSFYFTKGGTLAKGKKPLSLFRSRKRVRYKQQGLKSGSFHGTEPLGLIG